MEEQNKLKKTMYSFKICIFPQWIWLETSCQEEHKNTKYLEVPKEFFDQLMQLKGKITFNWTLHLMKKKVTPVKGYPSKLSYWISTRETFVSVNFCVNQKLWLPRYNQCVLITDTSIVCLAWAVDWLSAPGCLDVVSDLPSQTVYRVPTLQCSGIETCYNTRLA